jgi:hypothetical protein
VDPAAGPFVTLKGATRAGTESTLKLFRQRELRRVGRLSLALALAFAGLAVGPLGSASAQCPGCDEYTLDIPTPGGNKPADPTQEPSAGSEDPAAAAAAPTATAPVPVAPTEPAPAAGVTSGEVAPVVPEGSGIRERRGPRLPVTMRTIEPRDPVADSAQRQFVPAAVSDPPERGSTVPLFAVMAAIAIAGAAYALWRRRATRGGVAARRLAAR